MSNFAQIDENGIVIQVLVGNDSFPNEGYDWFVENLGGTWVKTSYNTQAGVHKKGGIPLRKNYAGIGMKYDSTRDAFITQKPFTSWTLDEATCQYKPPTPYPTDGKRYSWDETVKEWKVAI